MSDNQDLIHRINRIQGQLEAIKKQLAENRNPDCTQTMQQLKAASRAMKKFGEAYVQQHLVKCMNNSSAEEAQKELAAAVGAAFNF